MHGNGKSQGEAIAIVFEAIREKGFRGRDKFGEYSASEADFLRREVLQNHRVNIRNLKQEITRIANDGDPDEVEVERRRAEIEQRLNEVIMFEQLVPAQQRIGNFMEQLASNNEENIRRIWMKKFYHI